MQLRQNEWRGYVRGSITLIMLPDAYRMEYEFDREGFAVTSFGVVDRTCFVSIVESGVEGFMLACIVDVRWPQRDHKADSQRIVYFRPIHMWFFIWLVFCLF